MMRFRPFFFVVVLTSAACNDGEHDRPPPGSLPTCEDYCERLRTSDGGCAGEVELCPRDCELWRRENADAGCEVAFDDLLACTAGTDEVCMSSREECSPEWGRWADCIDRCDVPSVGEVTFSPICPPEDPCPSGTELTMLFGGPLDCSALGELTCAGSTTYGFLSPSDTTASGTITLACTQPSGCVFSTSTAFLLSSSSTPVSCTP